MACAWASILVTTASAASVVNFNVYWNGVFFVSVNVLAIAVYVLT